MTRDWFRGYDPFYVGAHIFARVVTVVAPLGVIAILVYGALHGWS